MKICWQCKISLDLSQFSKCAASKDGLQGYCKSCRKLSYAKNKQTERRQQSSYYTINKVDLIKKSTLWAKQNRKRRNAYMSEYEFKRRQVDINFKLSKNIRSRISKVLHGHLKSGSAIKDLGCSVDFLISHLESKFTENMSWKNYGKWHVDHIQPLSSFDLNDKIQFLKAVNYTNLQPLWAFDNISKSNKVNYYVNK